MPVAKALQKTECVFGRLMYPSAANALGFGRGILWTMDVQNGDNPSWRGD